MEKIIVMEWLPLHNIQSSSRCIYFSANFVLPSTSTQHNWLAVLSECTSTTNCTWMSWRSCWMLARADRLSNLCRMSSSGHILGSYSFLYTIYFLLIPLAITRSVLFGLLQCRFQSFNSFSCSSKSLLQFRKFTAKISIITYQLQNQSSLFSWYLSS